jgi:hypothetical protein
MALMKDIVTASGISVPNSYIRVESIAMARKDSMTYVARAYVNASALVPVMEWANSCAHGMDKNILMQSYLHLKTLPEFANAVDC